ncbi:MAG: penicillin acylase family protein [Pseudomonadota bacterium]|nr:penicillin acylase family protein [Pseudomonadota bacterium]
MITLRKLRVLPRVKKAALVVATVIGMVACGSSDPVTTAGSNPTPPPVNPGAPVDNIFMTIVPPGANGNSAGGVGTPVPGVPPLSYPANFRDQLDMYGNLAYAQIGLKGQTCTPPRSFAEHQKASDQACNYFKPAEIRLSDADAVSSRELTAPNGKKVVIRRDGWGIPYIEGDDRSSTQYGVGFAAAQDRLWLFDVLRRAGRGQASEFLGPASTTYDLDLQFGSAGGYSEAELTLMVEAAIDKIGTLGTVFLDDTNNFVAGMNAYIAYLQTPQGLLETPPEYATLALQVPPVYPPRPFTLNDIVANAVLIQAQFGRGGGSEASNLDLLQKLDASFTAGATTIPKAACDLWRDLRHANAPDTPYTTQKTFLTQSPPSVDETCPQTLPAGAAIWDVGSLRGREFINHGGAGLGLPLIGPLPAGLFDTVGIGIGPFAAPAQDKKKRSWIAAVDARLQAQTVLPPLRAAAGEGIKLVASADPTVAMKDAMNALGLPKTSSNWIGVNADQTESGHPIIVAGPQTSYFNPQLLWEFAVYSNGGTSLDLAARGISTVNLPYVVIGHGLDFGWSATSAGSDLIDTRVSVMCNTDGSTASRDDNDGDGFPDADGYEYKGRCVRFYKRLDEWVATPTLASIALGGPTLPENVKRFVLRTHYGPVTATATVNSAPVAISEQRSTFNGDVDTTAPFALLTTQGMQVNERKFKELFNSMTSTFNWIYSDSRDLAFIQSGLYPLRHPQQHPELPVWGDGNYEWVADQNLPENFFDLHGGDGNDGALAFPSRARPQVQGDALDGYFEWPGYLPLEAHVQDTNPAQGYLANWNNSAAPGWWAADANGTYGPTHRMAMLRDRLVAFKASGRKHDIGTMIEVMGDAAFTDLRGQELLPRLLSLMEGGELTDDQRAAADLMQQWMDRGSHEWIDSSNGLGSMRRDRDADGAYDQRAQVVLMDAWYPHLIDALMPQLVAVQAAGASALTGRYDAPRAQGSAYQEGWFQHMIRAIDTVQGKPGVTPYRVIKCADGTLAGCRAGVLTALDQALGDLGGLSNQSAWDGTQLRYPKSEDCGEVESCDTVDHTSFSFIPVPAIHWTNRPTFQQATQVGQDRNGN